MSFARWCGRHPLCVLGQGDAAGCRGDGGRLARWIKPGQPRWVILGIAIEVGVICLVR
jgi:hypothetical protein